MASNLQESFYPGCKPINPKYCKTCVFSHGDSPFEDAPEKRYCRVFTRESGIRKPNDVYYDGAECPAYEEEVQNSQYQRVIFGYYVNSQKVPKVLK